MFRGRQRLFIEEDESQDYKVRAFLLASCVLASILDAQFPDRLKTEPVEAIRAQQASAADAGWKVGEPLHISDNHAQGWCMSAIGTFYTVTKKDGKHTLNNSYTFIRTDNDNNEIQTLTMNAGDVIDTNCFR